MARRIVLSLEAEGRQAKVRFPELKCKNILFSCGRKVSLNSFIKVGKIGT